MTSLNLADDLLGKLGGVSKHDLNSLLHISDSSDGPDYHPMFAPSDYYDVNSFVNTCKNLSHVFSSMSINIDSIHAKFDALQSFLRILSDNDFFLTLFLYKKRGCLTTNVVMKK